MVIGFGGGGGGIGKYIRNLSRSPGYGLRGRRKDYNTAGDQPVGPKLTRGRGLFRRRRPELGVGMLLVFALSLTIALVGLALILSGTAWSV